MFRRLTFGVSCVQRGPTGIANVDVFRMSHCSFGVPAAHRGVQRATILGMFMCVSARRVHAPTTHLFFVFSES